MVVFSSVPSIFVEVLSSNLLLSNCGCYFTNNILVSITLIIIFCFRGNSCMWTLVWGVRSIVRSLPWLGVCLFIVLSFLEAHPKVDQSFVFVVYCLLHGSIIKHFLVERIHHTLPEQKNSRDKTVASYKATRVSMLFISFF